MIIRRAKKDDAQYIINLLEQVLEVHHKGRPDIFKGSCRKYTDDELYDIIEDDSRPIFVAEENGDVLGYAFCIITQHINNNILTDIKSLYIDDLCVDENVRGKHIGTKLYNYVLDYAKEKDEPPFIFIADEITDPHNLGAIIRTANVCGAHGVIIPKRRNATVNATVAKASAGAVSVTNIARVTNLTATIEELKKNNIWVYGLEADGEKMYYEHDLKGPIAIVVGSEGFGMSRIVREACDFIVKIPVMGAINSLNASVATGVLAFEILKQRLN